MPLYRTVSDRGLWKKNRRNEDPKPQHFHKPQFIDKSKPLVTYSQLDLGEGYRYNSRQSIPDIRKDIDDANNRFDEAYNEDFKSRRSRFTKSCPTTPRATTPTRSLSRARIYNNQEPEEENYYMNNARQETRQRSTQSQCSYVNPYLVNGGNTYNGNGQYYPDDDRYSFESRSLTAYSNYSERDSVQEHNGFRYPYSKEPLYKDLNHYNIYPDQTSVERENPFQTGKSANAEAEHVVQMFLQKSFFPNAINNNGMPEPPKPIGKIEDFMSPESPRKETNGRYEPPNATSSPTINRRGSRHNIAEMKKTFLAQSPSKPVLQKPKANKYLKPENKWQSPTSPTSPTMQSPTDSSYHSMYSPQQLPPEQTRQIHIAKPQVPQLSHMLNQSGLPEPHFMSDTVTTGQVPQLHHAEVVRVRKETTSESSEMSSEEDVSSSRRISININPLPPAEKTYINPQENTMPPLLKPPPQSPHQRETNTQVRPRQIQVPIQRKTSSSSEVTTPTSPGKDINGFNHQEINYNPVPNKDYLQNNREDNGNFHESNNTEYFPEKQVRDYIPDERSFVDPAYRQTVERFRINSKPKKDKKGFFSFFKKPNKPKPYGDDYIHIEPRRESDSRGNTSDSEPNHDIPSDQSPHFHILKKTSMSSDDYVPPGTQPAVPMPGSDMHRQHQNDYISHGTQPMVPMPGSDMHRQQHEYNPIGLQPSVPMPEQHDYNLIGTQPAVPMPGTDMHRQQYDHNPNGTQPSDIHRQQNDYIRPGIQSTIPMQETDMQRDPQPIGLPIHQNNFMTTQVKESSNGFQMNDAQWLQYKAIEEIHSMNVNQEEAKPVMERTYSMSKPTNLDELEQSYNTNEDKNQSISVPIRIVQTSMSKPTNLDEVQQGIRTNEKQSDYISVPIQIEQTSPRETKYVHTSNIPETQSFSEKQFDPSIHERTQEIDIDAILALGPTPEETSSDMEDEYREDNGNYFIEHEAKLAETAVFNQQLLEEKQRLLIQQKMMEDEQNLATQQRLLEEEQRQLEAQNHALQQQLFEEEQKRQEDREMAHQKEFFDEEQEPHPNNQEVVDQTNGQTAADIWQQVTENNQDNNELIEENTMSDEEDQTFETISMGQRRKPKSIFNFSSFKKKKNKNNIQSRPHNGRNKNNDSPSEFNPQETEMNQMDAHDIGENIQEINQGDDQEYLYKVRKKKGFGSFFTAPKSPNRHSSYIPTTEEENTEESLTKDIEISDNRKKKGFGNFFGSPKKQNINNRQNLFIPSSSENADLGQNENSYHAYPMPDTPNQDLYPTNKIPKDIVEKEENIDINSPLQEHDVAAKVEENSPDATKNEDNPINGVQSLERIPKKNGMTTIFNSYKTKSNKKYSQSVSVPKLPVNDTEAEKLSIESAKNMENEDLAQQIVREIRKSTTELNERSKSLPKLNSGKSGDKNASSSIFGSGNMRLSMRKARKKSSATESSEDQPDASPSEIQPVQPEFQDENSKEEISRLRSNSTGNTKRRENRKAGSNSIIDIFGGKSSSKKNQHAKRRPVSTIGLTGLPSELVPQESSNHISNQVENVNSERNEPHENRQKPKKSSSGLGSLFGLDSSSQKRRQRSQSNERKRQIPEPNTLQRQEPQQPPQNRNNSRGAEGLVSFFGKSSNKGQVQKSPERYEPQENNVRQGQQLHRPTERPPLPPQSNYQDLESPQNARDTPSRQTEPEHHESQRIEESPTDETSFKPRQMGRRSKNFRKSITSGSLASEVSMPHQTSLNRQTSFSSQHTVNNDAQSAFMESIISPSSRPPSRATLSRRPSLTSQGTELRQSTTPGRERTPSPTYQQNKEPPKRKPASVGRTESYRQARGEDDSRGRGDSYNSLPRAKNATKRRQQQIQRANSEDSLRTAIEVSEKRREEEHIGGRGHGGAGRGRGRQTQRQGKEGECSVM